MDSSAIVKLYVVEPGSQTVRDLFRNSAQVSTRDRVLVCDLALPETVSALQQIARGPSAARKGLSVSALRRTLPRVQADFNGAIPIHMNAVSECMREAVPIIERQQLRPGDALHVASALLVQQNIPAEDELTFVSADQKHCDAARREGLRVLALPGA
nr:type II toxin-antitoxin system VapC family toxin [Longimicrobium terrae]